MSEHERCSPGFDVARFEDLPGPRKWVWTLKTENWADADATYATRREATVAAQQYVNQQGFERRRDEAIAAGRIPKPQRSSAATIMAAFGIRPLPRPRGGRGRGWSRR